MTDRLQLFAVIGALVLFLVVVELVRSRRMLERYALLWLLCSIALAALALWTGLLGQLADWAGIKTPSNGLFVVAFGFALLLLLHFSVVISSLSDKSVVLAQQVGLLQQELDRVRQATGAPERGTGGGPAGTPGELPSAPDERPASHAAQARPPVSPAREEPSGP